jgi:hypothetical protein
METKKSLALETKRSIGMRIDKGVYAKLLVVCEAYGTNTNSYIVNELGRSISKDHEAVTIKAEANAVFTKMESLVDSMQGALEIDDSTTNK